MTTFHIQNDIRDVHSASVSGDLELLKEKSKNVRSEVFNSKDRRGLTPLHKVITDFKLIIGIHCNSFLGGWI